MKIIKILSVIAGGILLAAILLLVFGNKTKLPKGVEENWLAVKPVPFSGYICGYIDTMPQIPILLPESSFYHSPSFDSSPSDGKENTEELEYLLEEVKLFDEKYLEETVRPVMNGTVTRQEPLTKAEEACLNYKVAEIKSGEHIDLDGDGTRENVTLRRDPTRKEETADWILTVGNSTEIIPYYYDLTGKIYVAAIEKKRGDMQLIQLLLPGRESLVMDEEAEVYWYAFGKLEHLRRIPCGENGIESVEVSGNGDLITSDLNSRYVRSYRTVRFRITLLRAAEFSIPRLAELPLEPVAYSDWAVSKHTLYQDLPDGITWNIAWTYWSG